MKRRNTSIVLAVLAAAAIVATGCSGNNSAAGPTTEMEDVSFARTLGITNSPITADQATAIAEKATGGTATEVEKENENGTQVYDVDIRTSEGMKDVLIRISDGAVMKIQVDEDEQDGNNNDQGDDEQGESENDD